MSASNQAMEHRCGTRVRLQVAGKLVAADGTALRALVIDASLSGALVHVPADLAALSRVKLRVYTGPGTWMEACVVRRAGAGFGLEWLDPGSQSVCELLAMHDSCGPPDPNRDAIAWKLRRLSGAHLPAASGDS